MNTPSIKIQNVLMVLNSVWLYPLKFFTMATQPLWSMNSGIILQVWSQVNLRLSMTVCYSRLFNICDISCLLETDLQVTIQAGFLVQQGFETQGWQLISNNQRKQILKNFKLKLKAKKFWGPSWVQWWMQGAWEICLLLLQISFIETGAENGKDPRHLHWKFSSWITTWYYSST